MPLLTWYFLIGSFFHSLKKKIVGESKRDDKEEEHKEQFTALAREIKNAFRHDGLLLTLSVLPNVNSSGKFTKIPNIRFRKFVNYNFLRLLL